MFNKKETTSDRNRGTSSDHQHSEARGGAWYIPGAGEFTSQADAIPDTGPSIHSQLEPIRAWRGIKFGASGSTVGMAGGHSEIVAGEQPRAICRGGSTKHLSAAPKWDCSCGYYAVKNIDDARSYGHLAEVDLYGTVIEHDTGYRAEYMRVLSLRIPRSFCEGSFLCQGTPEAVVFPERVSYPRPASPYGPNSYQPPPFAVCLDCAPKYERSATLQQIAARLGCEVRWEEQHPEFSAPRPTMPTGQE